MTNQQKDPVRRKKSGRESWEHAGAKWSIAYILHELGFKVFREPTLEVKGLLVRPDLIAIKGHAAIIVEIGQCARAYNCFTDLGLTQINSWSTPFGGRV